MQKKDCLYLYGKDTKVQWWDEYLISLGMDPNNP